MAKRKPYPHNKPRNKNCVFPVLCKCPTCKETRTELWEKPKKKLQHRYCDSHKENRCTPEEGEAYADGGSTSYKPAPTRKAKAAI
jgi:hypothetical protein